MVSVKLDSAAAALLLSGMVAGQHPARALAAAVDQPDPERRRAAATQLAAREDVTLALWIELMRGFGDFEAFGPGQHRHEAQLPVDGALESTELFVYQPPSYRPDTPAPLLLAAHGTGGSGRRQIAPWRAVADQLGMLVLAPSEAGSNEGYDFSRRERHAALAAVRWLRRRWNVDENRVFLTGVSRGGHLVWDLATRFPDRWAAAAPLIGGPRWNPADGQNNLRYLENIVHLPLRDLQGDGDDPRLLSNLAFAFDRLAQLGARDAQWVRFEHLGHAFDLGAVDWVEFLGAATRDPRPDSVVLRCAVLREARSSWVEVLALDRSVRESVRPRIDARRWQAADDQTRRRLVQKQVDERTARIQAEWTAPGVVRVEVERVQRFRLLLREEDLEGDGHTTVRVGSRRHRVRPTPDARVLLEDFVERFDRTFLPVAEVVIER